VCNPEILGLGPRQYRDFEIENQPGIPGFAIRGLQSLLKTDSQDRSTDKGESSAAGCTVFINKTFNYERTDINFYRIPESNIRNMRLANTTGSGVLLLERSPKVTAAGLAKNDIILVFHRNYVSILYRCGLYGDI